MAQTAADEASKTRLSKAAVVDRALALSDAEGLDALTVRRLATELGVTPMALYWHFRSKEELLGGLADRLWAEIDTDVDEAADWPQQLRGLLESLVRVLREHPSASTLLLAGNKLNSEAALVATETTLEVLRRAGFDPPRAAAIARNALFTGLMLVMSEPGFEPGMSEADRAEMQRRNRLRLALLPPDSYPRLVEAAVPMTACDDPDLHYQFGVDLFIAGVQAIAKTADGLQHPAGPA
ncbi:MAG TPA: TetR family transcriptional regulator [Streptosporangiaceae bacterium]|nr:TetR family transcriptional regulator [Streptosporangiaceae bacterium]